MDFVSDPDDVNAAMRITAATWPNGQDHDTDVTHVGE